MGSFYSPQIRGDLAELMFSVGAGWVEEEVQV